MNAQGVIVYIGLILGIGFLVGLFLVIRNFGANFFNQAVAMAASIGTFAERFLRRGAKLAADNRSKVRDELRGITSDRKGVVLIGLLIFPIWVVAVRTARKLDAQLLEAVFEDKNLAHGLSFLLVAFTSIAGFIITDLISPVKMPFLPSDTKRGRAGMAAALLVLVPLVATIQINLAKDRANTFAATEQAKITKDRRILTETLSQTTEADEQAVLNSSLKSLKEQSAIVTAKAERQRRQGTIGGLTAAAVEAVTSFSLPLAFLVSLIAALWLFDGLLAFAAGVVSLITLLIRALPGLFRRTPRVIPAEVPTAPLGDAPIGHGPITSPAPAVPPTAIPPTAVPPTASPGHGPIPGATGRSGRRTAF